MIGFNPDNVNQDQIISNDTILYLCNNILRIEDSNIYCKDLVYPNSNEEVSTEQKEKMENSKKSIVQIYVDENE